MSDHYANDMERRIDEVLHKNRENLHLVSIPRTPLELLLQGEAGGYEDDDEMRADVRRQTFRGMLEFIFQSGPEPLQVLRHVFAMTKAVRPDLLGDMSLEDISIICADGGRATVSARIQRIYNGTLTKAGMKDARASFQKTGNFSEPQKGNQNRAGRKKSKARDPLRKKLQKKISRQLQP